MCVGCKARINSRFAVAIALVGILLFINGIGLVVTGSIWDSLSAGSEDLYVIQVKDKYYDYNIYRAENPVLMYQGLLVSIPVIPAMLQLFKQVRSSTIMFLLSLVAAFGGSLAGAVLSGITWRDMQLVFRSYDNGLCHTAVTQCTCELPNEGSMIKTANFGLTNCVDIVELHSIISIYFAVSIVATLLVTIATYLGCTVCCNAEDDKQDTRRPQHHHHHQQQQQPSRSGVEFPPSYSTVYENPSGQPAVTFSGSSAPIASTMQVGASGLTNAPGAVGVSTLAYPTFSHGHPPVSKPEEQQPLLEFP